MTNEQELRCVKCTYTTTMAAYFESVTTSPYSQAVKLLKTHQKSLNT